MIQTAWRKRPGREEHECGGSISSMHRSFESVRPSVKGVPARRQMEFAALEKGDQIYRQWLAPPTSSKMNPRHP